MKPVPAKTISKSHRASFQGRRFKLTVDARFPDSVKLHLDDRDIVLPSLGGVHTLSRWDALSRPRLASIKRTKSGQIWIFAATSQLWKSFRTIWVIDKESCRVHHEVSGCGNIDVVSFFEYAPLERMPEKKSTLRLVRRVKPPLRSYSRPAPYFHTRVYCPQPVAGKNPSRPLDQDAHLSAACTFGPIDFNTWFSPGLFCFGLLLNESEEGLFFGLNVRPGHHQYHTFSYHAGAGWGLSASFDGMVKVEGKWNSPEVEIAWADSVDEGLSAHVASGRKRGWFPEPAPPPAVEWKRPIYCGWGQQCVWSSRTRPGRKPDCINELVMPSAGALANEKVYREMLRIIDDAKLPIGTLTIDMGWSVTQSLPQPDKEKWPNLKEFISEQHDRGRKVLLWLSCWEPKGLPETMWMKAAPGLRPALDPTHPEFKEALARGIHEVISSDGLDADGFKLDFSGDLPRGQGYQPVASLWGVELLLDYVGQIYRHTKSAKPAAILQTHCANPLFADRTDILRLNDIFDDHEDVRSMMAHRARMARIASPGWLIDTDGDPFISRRAWWNYTCFQPEIGIPSLMTLTGMSRSNENIPKKDLSALRTLWLAYYQREGIPNV